MARRLTRLLEDACPSGHEVAPESGWQTGAQVVFRPDIMVYAPVSRRAKLLETPPVLIVEVLSTSSKREDLGRKLGLYARGGAAFYWVVDPDAEEVTVLANDSGRFVTTQQLTDGVASELTQPFPVRLDLTALFA